MELRDLYDEKGKPLDRKQECGKPLPEGEYFLSVDVWVVTSEGKILVVKKETQEDYIEKWGNVSGSLNEGETGKECVLRELGNIGIQTISSEIVYLGSVVSSEYLVETYLLVKDILMDDLAFGKENANEAKFVDDNVIGLMHQSDLLVKDIWKNYKKYNDAMLAHTHFIIEKAKLSYSEEMVNAKFDAFRVEIEMYGKDPFASTPMEEEKKSEEIKNIKNYAYVVRELEDDKIIGGVYGTVLDDKDICIKCIFILEKFQNKELGTLLINFLEREFQGVRCWKTFVPYKSWRQQHFFEKFGYIKVGESKPEAKGFHFLYYEKGNNLKVETQMIAKEVPKVEKQVVPEEISEKESQIISKATAIKKKVHYFELRKNVWLEALDKE